MRFAGGIKMSRVAVANVMHIGQHIGNSSVYKNPILCFLYRRFELTNASFEEQFTEKQGFFQKQLLNALLACFERNLPGNLGVATIALRQQLLYQTGFAGARTSNKYNELLVHLAAVICKLRQTILELKKCATIKARLCEKFNGLVY